ncbi:heterokaryon incompatibility protein-domain-containing protein, partial [Podospora conica]
MIRWHKSTCAEPDVHPRNWIPFCSTCAKSAVWNPAIGKTTPGIPPLPTPPEDGIFQLWWPSSVSYTESDGDNSSHPAGPSPALSAGPARWTQAREPVFEASLEGAANTSESGCRVPVIGYAPLSKNHIREIRLLRLLPGVFDDPIHGELIIAPLQGHRSFTALSYTWADEDGDRSRSCVIFLGNHWDVFPVTQNCAAALRRMRLEDHDRMVWVDAICIDQGNHVERNHQVGLMTEVYSSAQGVFVYLGQRSTWIATLMKKINRPDNTRPSFYEILTFGPSFFGLPYFSRIWVVQEVANARSVTVQYGSRNVDWADLRRIPNARINMPAWIKAGYDKSKPTFQDFAQLLLDTSTSTIASDPRDSVFALFGLAKDCASHGLVADYTLSVPEVYIGAAAFSILNLGDRRVFRYAVGHNSEGIPTWVPAWGKFRTNAKFEAIGSIKAEELLVPAIATAHPTNCGCDKWGYVSISKQLGALTIFAATILDLDDFNSHWMSFQNDNRTA